METLILATNLNQKNPDPYKERRNIMKAPLRDTTLQNLTLQPRK